MSQHAIRISEWLVGLGSCRQWACVYLCRCCLERSKVKEKISMLFFFQWHSCLCVETKKATKEQVAVIFKSCFNNQEGCTALEISCFYWSYLEPVATILEEKNSKGQFVSRIQAWLYKVHAPAPCSLGISASVRAEASTQNGNFNNFSEEYSGWDKSVPSHLLMS